MHEFTVQKKPRQKAKFCISAQYKNTIENYHLPS